MNAEPIQPDQPVQNTQQWHDFRQQMPITERWAYFDHAAVAPLTKPAQTAMTRWAENAAFDGDADWPAWSRRIESFRNQIAGVLNATTAEIALVPNTTAGINLLAEGFPWESGDNVVTLDNEFPSNLYPWSHLADLGVTTRRVPTNNGRVDLDRVASSCDERTRVVSLSWIGYASGWRIDVAAAAQVAHDNGAIFCLDAIQGLGVFPLDVQAAKVDFLAADGHKWLLGPEGAGISYIQADLLERLRPTGVGWNSVEHRYDFSKSELLLRKSAARYEGGSQNMVGFHGLAASLDLLIRMGLGPSQRDIADRVVALTDRLREKLCELGADLPFDRAKGNESGILTFQVPGVSPESIRAACLRQQVIVSCRGGGIRAAPHAYNNFDDIDRLAACVQGLVG